jgi:glutamyl-Q tRNA(Asp) synthetase
LHLGSLVAALASYLDARSSGGRWLLRIDDLDEPRVRPGCDTLIVRQLTNLGLSWDGEIRYQSQHLPEYQRALNLLRETGRLFACDCSRRALRAAAPAGNAEDAESVCVGGCRGRIVAEPAALRVDLGADGADFEDRWQGRIAAGAAPPRDLVVKRRDGIFAYHLAVVVDDLASGVTDVVRGADLIASTAAQRGIYRALGAAAPRYAHAPVVTEPDGSKLAKSSHSVAIGEPEQARIDLIHALRLLCQDAPDELEQVQVGRILEHATREWSPARFAGIRSVAAGR